MPTGNSIAENIFGTIGTICWTIQLVPQLWKSFREKDTTGLSDWMILTWAVSDPLLGIYSVVIDLNIPLIIQPQIFSALALCSWAQCQYYGRRRSLRSTVLWTLLLGAVFAGFELGMVYALRPSYERGEESSERGVDFFGIMSSVLIAVSFIPQYYEIYRRREVIGISIIFMTVDLLGGVFSYLSLAFKSGRFDAVAAVTYTMVVVTDSVVIVAAWILNPSASRRRRRLATPGQLESGSAGRGLASLPNHSNEGTAVDSAPTTIVTPSLAETVQATPRSSSKASSARNSLQFEEA
ncbi:hypothetical protein GYMLUDRAFT_597934 [Collybiopsis luxurians FD-317 M1]|uniref:PQ-loop-domain-containing protein n=1 Tax=Collybiopsis luxurians FD-317 M1 TaxID=944289 RepID=A0A0D0CPR9_9AGAR|nr:hypothetical protein GYMLUDRAFT_597934 [Collybiopsis luxurians FD-317 M1]